MKKFATLTMLLALSGVSSLYAISSAAGGSQNSNSSTTQNMNSGAGGSMMLNSTDRKFMVMAAMGGMAEIETARMALERASSDSIKQYAQKMIDDHTKVGDELKELASSKGVTLPTAVDAKHKAMMNKLMKLSGAAFDREYIMSAGVKDHEKMLKLLQDEVRKGKDADVKAFASKTIPAVQEHHRMARDLMSGAMGGKNSGMKSTM